MPRVRMLRNTGGPDGAACLAGEVVDLPVGLAASFVATGRAVPADESPDGDEAGAPAVQHRPPPKRRTR